MRVVGIDPGTRKCGYAVIEPGNSLPLALGIVPTAGLAEMIGPLLARYAPVAAIALGGGTHAGVVAGTLAGLGLPLTIVDERETTLRARARFFIDNPPRGWRRLIPRGMLLPPRPIDDYAAVLIAERYLAGPPSSLREGKEAGRS